MNKFIYLLPALFVVGALSVVSLFVKNKIDYSILAKKSFPLERPMETAYTPRHNGLNIIILRLQNPQLLDSKNYTLSLLDGSGNVIKAIEFNAKNVGDPSDLRLQFDPIPNSTQIRSLRLSPPTPTDKLHVYIDDADRISFTSYYRSSGLALSWPNFGDTVFFVVWALGLSALFLVGNKWQKHS